MRSAACPSHSGGSPLRAGGWSRLHRTSRTRRVGSGPITRFVPWLTVTGRSVVSRRVRQGTPRTVVSSWTTVLGVPCLTLRDTTERQAGHAQDRRLLLDASRIGEDESGAAHQGNEVEVAQRIEIGDALAV